MKAQTPTPTSDGSTDSRAFEIQVPGLDPGHGMVRFAIHPLCPVVRRPTGCPQTRGFREDDVAVPTKPEFGTPSSEIDEFPDQQWETAWSRWFDDRDQA